MEQANFEIVSFFLILPSDTESIKANAFGGFSFDRAGFVARK